MQELDSLAKYVDVQLQFTKQVLTVVSSTFVVNASIYFLWSLQHIFQKFLLPVSHFRIAFSDWWSLFPFQKTKDKMEKCKKSKLL